MQVEKLLMVDLKNEALVHSFFVAQSVEVMFSADSSTALVGIYLIGCKYGNFIFIISFTLLEITQ